MTRPGFTLLETLIYLGFFSLLVTGVFVSVLALQDSAGRALARARLFSEYLYLSDRLDIDITSVNSTPRLTPDENFTLTDLVFKRSESSTTPESVTTSGVLHVYSDHGFVALPFTHTTYLGI